MTALDVLTLLGAVALIAAALAVAYGTGRSRALRDLDGLLETTRLLARYGALAQVEADAAGVTVQQIIRADAERAREGEHPMSETVDILDNWRDAKAKLAKIDALCADIADRYLVGDSVSPEAAAALQAQMRMVSKIRGILAGQR